MKRIPTYAAPIFAALVLALIVVLLSAQTVSSQTVATPTPKANGASTSVISVYVLSRGGKFIGDDIGGAQVTLRDAGTGEFLATGRTHGGSGTDEFMTTPRVRTFPIAIEDASVFTATIPIDTPRLIEFEAYGPLGAQGAANRITTTEWVLPPPFEPNQVILYMPGLNVRVLNPPTHFLPQTKPPLQIALRANVTMMCGCPIAPAYPWKPEDYQVRALIVKPDATREWVELQFDANAPDHAPSQFAGAYTATQSGIYQVYVMAHQVGEDNAGSDTVTFIVP